MVTVFLQLLHLIELLFKLIFSVRCWELEDMKANSSLDKRDHIVNKDGWYPSAFGGYLQLAKYFVILGGLFFFFV